MIAPYEEKVVWNKTFSAETFDFRDRMNFCRFDGCTFVRCTLLMDQGTEQIAFTACTFQDCNIDHLEPEASRGILSTDNIFDRPLEERRRDFEERLQEILLTRGTSSPNSPEG